MVTMLLFLLQNQLTLHYTIRAQVREEIGQRSVKVARTLPERPLIARLLPLH